MPVRCFLSPEAWPDGPEVRLAGREAHHLARVLRVRKGDPVLCFDGRGREMECAVWEAGVGRVLLRAGRVREVPPLPWEVSLGVAVPGQGKLEEIVNSSTQMGVVHLFPLLTERTVVRFTRERFEKKRDHLRQVAVEAAKQSGAARLPEIHPITPWQKFLPAFSGYEKVFLGAVEGPHEDWRSLLSAPWGCAYPKILLLIGPEGDFSPGEIRQAVAGGARPVSLGPSVLRCETAVTASLSILFFLLRESPRAR